MMASLNLGDIEAVMVDMDGVLWLGDRPLPGIVDFFGFLDTRQVPYVLATNNASRRPDYYVRKMSAYGVTISPANVLTSALATADWMRDRFAPGARVYVVGQEGLRHALAQAGFQVIDSADSKAEAVVAGIDFTLTYDKLRDAVLLIGRGAEFIGTNADPTYPLEEGLAPGGGAILKALETATGVAPTVVGKPHRPMFEAAVARLGRRRTQTAIIGDRLATDIVGGLKAGLKTILVLTGVDTPMRVRETGIVPDAIFEDLNELVATWRASS